VFTDSIFLEVWQAAEEHGINPVGMVAQALKETGGDFPGRVKPWFHNTCGLKVRYLSEVMDLLGTSDGDHPLCHQQFPNWQVGACAHAQHLIRYTGGLVEELVVDPRYWLVSGPPVTTWAELGGHWAPSQTYGQEIEALMSRLAGN
jgi:hypothetical protein